MRFLHLLFASFLVLAAPAMAEVNVDLHALDALPGDADSPAPSHRATPRHPAHHKPNKPTPQAAGKLPTPPPASPTPSTSAPAATTPAPTAPAATTPAATNPSASTPATTPAASTPSAAIPAAAPPAATLPTAPPPIANIPPVAAPPPAARAPAPPPPITAGATSVASAIPGGLRVTFDKAGTDLSPASAEQIKAVVQTLPAADAATVEVLAYAAGTPEDPSTARRLSLSRALAVRSALIADGMTASRIYVRALGAQPGDGPADRVDLTVLGDHAGAKPQAQ